MTTKTIKLLGAMDGLLRQIDRELWKKYPAYRVAYLQANGGTIKW